jgi:sugar lactone lactonase YvrE
VVRSFDRKTGAPIATVPISSASFLNDVSAAPDGSLYVSDSGLGKVSGSAELQKNGSDAVYTLDAQGVVGVLAKGADLGQPNGLLADGAGVLVATVSGLLYRLVPPGERQALGALPAGELDGMVLTEDGRLLISSWETSSVYVAKPPLEPTPAFSVLIADLKSPADLGYDPGRRQLLVPLFKENAIYIQQVF